MLCSLKMSKEMETSPIANAIEIVEAKEKFCKEEILRIPILGTIVAVAVFVGSAILMIFQRYSFPP